MSSVHAVQRADASVPTPTPVPTLAPAAVSSIPGGLEVRGLVKRFGDRTVLHGVDLSVRPGELVALLGANGSGKSTTLRCVAGLEHADAAGIELSGIRLDSLKGSALARARREASMVFQKVHLVPRRSALANVAAGGLARLPLARSLSPVVFPRALLEEALACLDRVGLADRAFDRAGRLSGGQQQRVAVARALCQRATVILADEPVSALDPHAAEQVMSLLRELAHREGLAVAAVLHQPDLARRYADRAVGLLDGRVMFEGAASDLDDGTLTRLYAPEASA